MRRVAVTGVGTISPLGLDAPSTWRTAVAGERKVREWLKDNANLQLGRRPVPVRDIIERIERELLK